MIGYGAFFDMYFAASALIVLISLAVAAMLKDL